MSVTTATTISDGAHRLWTWLDGKAGGSKLAKASYAAMAEALNVSDKTVARRLRELIDIGLIEVERAPAGHGVGHYVVVNPTRRADKSVAPTEDVDRTDLSESPDKSVAPSAVEGTDLSPLPDSLRTLGVDSHAECNAREASAVALLADAFDIETCAECGEIADGRPSVDGTPWCELHEPF